MARSQDSDRQAVPMVEKEHPLHLEDFSDPENPMSETKIQYLQRGLSAQDADFLLSLSEKEQNQIFRKVDFRLVPMLALLYLVGIRRHRVFRKKLTPYRFPI
jgi:hypothetical protein